MGAALLNQELFANPLGLPLGLQLYSVRDLLPKDYEGTLQQLAKIGYKEVEAAGYFGHTAAQVKQAMQNAGLNCVSAHYSLENLKPNVDETIAFCKEVGMQYVVCSSPLAQDPSRIKTTDFVKKMEALTMDDWKWNAEQFNQIGEKVNAAGLQFGYHNHRTEFHEIDGGRPYDVLMQQTDPKLVTFEMDCGWVVVGGGDPVELLKKYGKRISLLHVKDFKLSKTGGEPVSVEMGRGGDIDYRPIFAAGKGHIKHYFVEQEQFDMPVMEALKVDAEYMRKM
jgi:sugar phosphate isomerase/epimerase